MDLASPANRPIRQQLLLLLAALLVALAWLKPLDQRAQTHIETGLKRALATYAVARTINSVISVVQETGVSVQPGGVGMTFAPGQFLDPLNDLVEQVSSVMLAVCVSFGIQLILLHIGGSPLVSAALTLGVGLVAYRWWRRHDIPRWEWRVLVAMIFVRFAVPLAASGSEFAYGFAMADEYLTSQRALESTSSKVSAATPASAPGGKAEAPKPQGVWEFLKTIPQWGSAKSEDQQEKGKIEQIKAWLDGAVDHMLRLVAIFIVQTVLLPLFLMGLLGKLLGAVLCHERLDSGGQAMQIKKIFLASSEELKDDRRAFELMLSRLNRDWRPRDYTFDLVVWENFIDAMSKDGLQKEYNKAVVDCDIFVMMFFTKVGPYTLEEFEAAFADMKAGTGPRIYTYLRNDFILSAEIDDSIKSLLDFKKRLTELKHYVTTYRNTEDLQYQFSRQLEMLYGDAGAEAQDIDDATPQLKVGEVALLLTYRQLNGAGSVEPIRLQAAVERCSRQVRNTLFSMASDLRRDSWLADKRLMERTIPVFEALVRADPLWHAPIGQLGYALVDKVVPDWRRAKECLDRAVELRGDRIEEGYFYQYNRARCAVQLDPAFAARQPATGAAREAVLEVIKQARRELDADWERLIRQPDSEPLRAWLQLNGSPRLR